MRHTTTTRGATARSDGCWRARSDPLRRIAATLLVGLIAIACLAGPAPAVPDSGTGVSASPPCSLAPGNYIRWVGLRPYRLHVPSGLTSPAKLVLSMHGGALNSLWMETWSGWNAFADTHKFIVAYPEGRWEIPPPGVLPVPGANYWDPSETDSPDVPYLLGVTSDIRTVCSVASNRIHLHGVSQGGWMAQRMMCHAAGTFASAAAGAAGHPEVDPWHPPADGCAPSRPVSLYLGIGVDDASYSVVAAGRNVWTTRQHCPDGSEVPETPYGLALSFRPCDSGSQIVWRELADIGHDPLEPIAPEVTQRVLMEQWLFFSANPRP
jgi:polyhydroxybutyrate depolymerase